MKFTKLKGEKLANVNVFSYKLDFDNIKGSKPEILVKTFLKSLWSNDLVLEEFRIPGSKLRIDIVNINKKIAVEVSPSGTHSFNKFFHKNVIGFCQRLDKEIQKSEWCIKNGFVCVELGDEELKDLTKKMFKEKYNVDL